MQNITTYSFKSSCIVHINSTQNNTILTATNLHGEVLKTSSVGSALTGTYGQLTLNANGSYSYAANQSAAVCPRSSQLAMHCGAASRIACTVSKYPDSAAQCRGVCPDPLPKT